MRGSGWWPLLHPAHVTVVIAGLDPAIHSGAAEACPQRRGVDARIKSGHDDEAESAVILRR
jgi:hypothetical protein